MALSKKHFIAIAADIKSCVANIDPSPEYAVPRAAARAALYLLAEKLCDTFTAENAQFDRARFLKACGF